MKVDIVLNQENQNLVAKLEKKWQDILSEAQNDMDYLSKVSESQVIKSLTEKSSIEIMILIKNLIKQQNCQRVLDFMKYDKIESWNQSRMVKCSNGWIIYDLRSFDINDDTGMCSELAIKACAYFKLMFPEEYFFVAQDKKRPSGWNHFFVCTSSSIDDDTIDFIIDPSENKQGYLSKTGGWDGTGVDYSLSIENISKIDTNTFEPDLTVVEKNKGRLPLISPRHFDPENLGAFDFSLNIESGKALALDIARDGICANLELKKEITTQEIIGFGKENSLNIPQDLATRLVEMAQKFEQHTINSNLSMTDFRTQNQNLENLDTFQANFDSLKTNSYS